MSEDSLGVLETTGLTPAMVALDTMLKTADVRPLQVELNDNYGVCLKIAGTVADVQTSLQAGRRIAETMGGRPVTDLIARPDDAALRAILSRREFNPLIQQEVVFIAGPPANPSGATSGVVPADSSVDSMNSQHPMALGFLETQGFTAVIEAIDTACKAAQVNVVAKEKLGGGYVTVVIEGDLSAVEAAINAGRERVDGLGKLIAAHVIARPQAAILGLLSKL